MDCINHCKNVNLYRRPEVRRFDGQEFGRDLQQTRPLLPLQDPQARGDSGTSYSCQKEWRVDRLFIFLKAYFHFRVFIFSLLVLLYWTSFFYSSLKKNIIRVLE